MMTKFSEEFKYSIVRRMMPPKNESAVEWNLAMNADASPFAFQSALDKFMSNFHHECTIPLNNESIISYEQDYDDYHQKHPELIRTITEIEESDLPRITILQQTHHIQNQQRTDHQAK